MVYRLRDQLSFCQIDNYLVFLDVQNDRYFRLSKTMENAFLSYLNGDRSDREELQRLVHHRILTDSNASQRTDEPLLDDPLRSAMERSGMPGRIRIGTLLDAFWTVFKIDHQLNSSSLANVLERFRLYRRSKTVRILSDSNPMPGQDPYRLSSSFEQARLLVPLDKTCLLDSIALATFLAKNSVHANIVLGIRGDPFSAHCWVQTGHLVLNDTLGNAQSHTRILVV